MAYTNINDPSAYFQTATYTGDGIEPRNIDVGFQADLIWAKDRTFAYHHRVFDSSRGGAPLYSNQTSVEDSYNDGPEIDFSSPYSNGFKIIDNPDGATNSYGVNMNNNLMVSWNWKANGGTTSSNTDGDVTSTVQVNQDAGFSIVTDGPHANTNARTIGHGLGVVPQVVIRRARNRVENWRVFHSAAGSTGALTLDGTAAHNSSTVLFTGVTSTTFGVGTDFSVNGNYNYVAYCFAEKQGYSRFGKYIGTGNRSQAPFVYTGFKPAFVMVRCSNLTGQWLMFDSARNPYNGDFDYILANQAAVEENSGLSFVDPIDFLSNGFRVMNYDAWMNGGGNTYVYMAFAENPFTTSTGVPTTAR